VLGSKDELYVPRKPWGWKIQWEIVEDPFFPGAGDRFPVDCGCKPNRFVDFLSATGQPPSPAALGYLPWDRFSLAPDANLRSYLPL
jgi:hypothetical protein